MATIEHLMSALAGLGIDNCYVDVDAAEIPIMAAARRLRIPNQAAGINELNAPKNLHAVSNRRNKDASLGTARSVLRIQSEILDRVQYPAIDATEQMVEVDFARDSYIKQVSRARTLASSTTSKRCARRGWRSAVALKTRS